MGAMTSGSWTYIPFNTRDFDTSSNFDTSTNTFTAPISGFYWFSAVGSMVQEPGSYGGIGLRFVKNGTALTSLTFNFDNNVSYDESYSTLQDFMQLSAGDTIKVQGIVQLNSGSGAFSSDGTYFTGFLVSAT
jgi:hypothetical protein